MQAPDAQNPGWRLGWGKVAMGCMSNTTTASFFCLCRLVIKTVKGDVQIARTFSHKIKRKAANNKYFLYTRVMGCSKWLPCIYSNKYIIYNVRGLIVHICPHSSGDLGCRSTTGPYCFHNSNTRRDISGLRPRTVLSSNFLKWAHERSLQRRQAS